MTKINWIPKNSSDSNYLNTNKYDELFSNFIGDRTISKNYHIDSLHEASKMIREAIALNQPIRIVGDYDVDGITATSELILGLKELKAMDIQSYLPKRFTDGYGLSPKIVEKFLGQVPSCGGLLITVDNGIAAIDAIDLAKEFGWTVLIIDHHLAKVDDNGNRELPLADHIIDPHVMNDADFIDYCGAGLVYKLWQQMGLSENTMAKITSLAMIGTVCDAVNLIEKSKNGVYGYDNYLIVKEGLHTILQNNGRTTGLYCLMRALKKDCLINEDDIGYTLGPTINAASRLNDDGATFVLNLLIKDDNKFNECDAIALELLAMNEDRKTRTNNIIPVLCERIEKANMQNDFPIVIAGEPEEIHLGLVGIVASHLMETYHSSSIVLTPIEGGLLKGSARAPEGTNIKLLLDTCANDMISYGGHEGAAGLTIKAEDINQFRKHLQIAAGEKPEKIFENQYDFELAAKDIPAAIEKMKKYAPYGKGNEVPIFKISPYELENRRGETYKIMGKNNNVIKLYNHYADAVEFSGACLEKIETVNKNKITLYGKLTTNTYMGKTTPQIIIEDIEEV